MKISSLPKLTINITMNLSTKGKTPAWITLITMIDSSFSCKMPKVTKNNKVTVKEASTQKKPL